MRKIILWVLIIILAGLWIWYFKDEIISSSRNDNNTLNKPVFKIGVILPITGNISDVGESARVIVDKVRDEVKNSNIDFQFIVENNSMNVMRTINIANKLVSLDKVNAVVSAFTGPATAVTQIANKNKLLHICVANDCDIQSGPYNFANWQHISVASKKLIELLKKHNAKKVVIFTAENSGEAFISENIRKDFKENGIDWEEFRFNPSERDFSLTVFKASQVPDVDYWFLNTLSPALELIRKQMILKNIDLPITSIQTFGDAQDEHKPLFKGFEYVEAAAVIDDVKNYINEKLGSKNITVAAYVYDSLNMIVKVVEGFYEKNNKIPDGAEMTEGLLEIGNYNGAVGQVNITPDRIMYSETVITTLD